MRSRPALSGRRMLVAATIGAAAALCFVVFESDPWESTSLDRYGWRACDEAAGRIVGTQDGADMSTRLRVELAANTNGQARRSEVRDVRRAGRVLDAASVAPEVAWLGGVRGFKSVCADKGYRRD